MKTNLATFIEAPLSDTGNGRLVMYQTKIGDSGVLPFKPKRILVMKDMKPGDERGGHTHYKTKQILCVLEGSCRVELDNGKRKETVLLKHFSRALYLPPLLWHVMKDFSPGTILMVIADTKYNEKDYIRSYKTFLSTLK